LTSKIINMADRIKDEEDRLLESMFESAPIADDGFSKQVVARVRRKLLLRQLTLPIAAAIGGLIAFKPAAGLITAVYRILIGMPNDLVASATSNLPSLQLIVTGALILLATLLSLNMLEE